MDFKRFTEIIKYNKSIETEIDNALEEFEKLVDIKGDSVKLIKEVGEALGVTIFMIPMKEADFGAVSYKTSYSKYILINTNQPLCKMNFSYYHDIYHIFKGSSNILNESREVHFNEDYLKDNNECKANLFSANILMPKGEFKYMFSLYLRKSGGNFKTTVYKLMNYFSSPYSSVLLRICELKLIEDMKIIEENLDYEGLDLIEEFRQLGISDEILRPRFTDDSKFLYATLQKESENLIAKGLIDRARCEKLYKSIIKLVEDIKKYGEDI